MTLAAVIDESRIGLRHEDEETLPSALQKFSSLLSQLYDDRVQRLKRSTIYEAQVLPNVLLMDILFSGRVTLDDDIRILLINQLDAISNWDIDNETSCSERFAITKLNEGEPIASIVFEPYAERLPGPPILHRVSDYRGLLAFYREAPEIGDYDELSYFSHTNRAFPDLFFKPNIVAECRRFSQAYTSIRAELTEALGALNDLLPTLRKQYRDLRVIQKEFAVRSGFEISPDSPKTHKNKIAMRERDIVVQGIRLCCEWHLKLKPHIDRVHFHFGHRDIGEGRIIVGILCDHLTS